MAEQLSGTIVVIIIAVGVQGCIMLFIFAKRQIMRFALRNKRGPHTSVAQGAPKPLRREVDRCLEYIPYIRHEPRVAPTVVNGNPSVNDRNFRAGALESYNLLEREMAGYSLNYTRLPGSGVRTFLVKCISGPLLGISQREVEVLADDYEHARHHYEEFGEDKLKDFTARVETFRRRLRENLAMKPHPSPIANSQHNFIGGRVGELSKNSGGGRKRKGKSTRADSVSVSFVATRGGSRTRLLQTPPQTEVVICSQDEDDGKQLTAV